MNNKGFTLIEMVVTIGILMVLAGAGITSMSQFYARDKIITARNDVVSTIRMAKNYSVTMQSPTVAILDAVAVVLLNANMLSIVPIYNGVLDVGNSYSTTVIKDTEVKLVSDGTNTIFSAPEGKLLKNDNTPQNWDYFQKISISAGGTGETRVVNVSAMGVIGE